MPHPRGSLRFGSRMEVKAADHAPAHLLTETGLSHVLVSALDRRNIWPARLGSLPNAGPALPVAASSISAAWTCRHAHATCDRRFDFGASAVSETAGISRSAWSNVGGKLTGDKALSESGLKEGTFKR
jgi:hypothetical protein